MDLEPSKLGTKAYWDEFYSREIRNFQENPQDTGECWFDDSGAEDRMVDYIAEEEGSVIDLNAESRVLDLGTGNGHLLFSLRDAGVPGSFLGIDYSEPSVNFAHKVAVAHDISGVSFQHHDLLQDSPIQPPFDLILDKGTLDAIALSDDREAKSKYVEKVRSMIKHTGKFMITSCNFTKKELTTLIDLPLADEIVYPQFHFGGQTGSSVVTLVFGK